MATKRRAPQLEFVPPCLPARALKPPTGSEWLHEIKLDGWRVEAVKAGDRVRLFTRRGLDWTDRFGPVAKAIAALKADSVILDGELVAEDPHGRPDFHLLRRALKGEGSSELVYHAFDILHLNGEDTRPLRLLERKARLFDVLEPLPAPNLRLVESFAVAGTRLLSEACRHGFEGIVSKRRDKPYRSGASQDWLKVTCEAEEVFPIVGYTQKGNRIGELLIGFDAGDGTLSYVGRVDRGLSDELARELLAKLEALRRPKPALDPRSRPKGSKGVTWVEPKLRAVVTFRGVSFGKLRHAEVKGVETH
jgi:bifunctional non-homologous end joining protein LigD